METKQLPSTMRAWQYTSTRGGLDKNLTLNPSAPLPTPAQDQHLIKVLATALNPVDFKPAEAPIVNRILIRKRPATPCIDVAGRVVTPAAGSSLKPGQLVFGGSATMPFAGAALAEYAAVPSSTVIPVPPGLSAVDAASIPVAALTAYQTILPHIKPGARVFLNGGSGGVGTFGIQLAKHAGAHVTVSCSAANAELCRSLGADDVLDYKSAPVLAQLQALANQGKLFDHVVDNVFSDAALYWKAHTYTVPHAKFVEVAGAPTLAFMSFSLKAGLWPGLLGGGKRKLLGFFAEPKADQLEEIAALAAKGEIRCLIDEVFAMDQGREAFVRIKTGRARGKVVVEVAKD